LTGDGLAMSIPLQRLMVTHCRSVIRRR
jgi:hypothetical protein